MRIGSGSCHNPGSGSCISARGDAAAAVSALRSALHSGPEAPLPAAQLIEGLIEAGVEADDGEAVALGLAHLEHLTVRSTGQAVLAITGSAKAWADAWRGDLALAIDGMRHALDEFQALLMPYEVARERFRIALVAERMDDRVTAQLELGAALHVFRRLGAEVDAARIERHLGGAAEMSPLTERELEVVRLVAGGMTNQDVADELCLSPHTVARHLGNVYTKVGVGSRAAATAWAYDHGLMKRT